MTRSFYCPECVTNWWPYQTNQGACPECGTGTRPSHDSAEGGRIVHKRGLVLVPDDEPTVDLTDALNALLALDAKDFPESEAA